MIVMHDEAYKYKYMYAGMHRNADIAGFRVYIRGNTCMHVVRRYTRNHMVFACIYILKHIKTHNVTLRAAP